MCQYYLLPCVATAGVWTAGGYMVEVWRLQRWVVLFTAALLPCHVHTGGTDKCKAERASVAKAVADMQAVVNSGVVVLGGRIEAAHAEQVGAM